MMDRDIETNLLDSYDRFMVFINKHLSDSLYMERTARISIRDKIFREAVANILMHREYSDLFVSKLIINKDKVIFENGNKTKEYKQITPDNFALLAKNPVLVKVFRTMDYAEEWGSGVRNMYKYAKTYGGNAPKIMDEKVFTTTIEFKMMEQAIPQAVLEFCENAKSSVEIMNMLELKDKKYFRTVIVKPLIEKGLLELTIPDKATSSKQRYRRVKNG
jgi:ATP-dependent DNA helicase RecG